MILQDISSKNTIVKMYAETVMTENAKTIEDKIEYIKYSRGLTHGKGKRKKKKKK